MNISSTTALIRELKPFEVPFLLTDDPRLKHHIFMYFEDWLKTIETRPGVYEKSETQKTFI